jgi:hypothetical protein
MFYYLLWVILSLSLLACFAAIYSDRLERAY